MFWLNSDLVGLVFGLLVFAAMAFIGWMTHVPLGTIARRALLGMVVGYVVGYFASSRIRKAVTTLMVKDRLERSRQLRESIIAREEEVEAAGEEPDEDELAGLR